MPHPLRGAGRHARFALQLGGRRAGPNDVCPAVTHTHLCTHASTCSPPANHTHVTVPSRVSVEPEPRVTKLEHGRKLEVVYE